MAWFRSNTLYMSASLFVLPVLAVCIVLCLPLFIFSVVGLYLIAWATYYTHAQTEAGFNIPYNPSRIIKINILVFGQLIGWIGYMPIIISYLYWRYWQIGSERFKEIVSTDIPFNGKCKLDVYHPAKSKSAGLSRIIVFVYGGGWGSGSKLLYTTLANTLRELGYVVVVPDYRKYPESKIDGIYQDIREAIKWTHQHATEINGDPEQIFVMGHSAGAQLVAQVVLSDIIEQAKYDEYIQHWKSSPPHENEKHDPAMKNIGTIHERHMMYNNNNKPRDFLPLVEGLLLFSGVYDIASHLIHETSRGAEKISVMARVMGASEEGYIENSPIHLIEKNSALFADSEDLLDLWPRILLLHGQKDSTVGMDQSANMFNTLGKLFPVERRQEVDVRMRLYKRMEHGEPVISLMSNIFSKKNEQNLLLRDIQEFTDVPLYVDES